MRLRVFVGSSREAIAVCRAVQAELEDDLDVTVWDQDVFRLNYAALDSLLEALDSSDAGVFVLRPDDLTTSRGESSQSVRDNVIFELGMFIGRLGRDRTFMLTPSSSVFHMPSDLLGLTTARYDAGRFDSGDERSAVGSACRKIRQAVTSIQVRVAPEPSSQARLDRAMRRMSKDLEYLLSEHGAQPRRSQTRSDSPADSSGAVSLRLGRTNVQVELGRIQDHRGEDSRAVIALPANEYFDDECITDTNSSLGAFVQHHFADRVDEFIQHVKVELIGLPSQRVPRAERRIDESYGIGQAVFLSKLQSECRLILVSATTERTGIGLRAEPHFLYAALEGIIEVMNERRLSSLTIPVLGSGHGGMPLSIAILFNILAVRSITNEDLGVHLRNVRIVVFEGDTDDLAGATMQDIISHVTPA
jgi:O-acetyl-ADP-ribose deacetylase (regulator of RNase III)